MKITITRAFERTRQIADFVPIKAYCEATAEMEVDEVVNPEGDKLLKKVFENLSHGLDDLVQAEVEKTLMQYYPTCIVCGGRGAQVNLNKEGVCGQCAPSRYPYPINKGRQN